MKRIKDKQQYKRFQRRRAKRSERDRHRWLKWRKQQGRQRYRFRMRTTVASTSPVRAVFLPIIAPDVLSMTANPEATIRFFTMLDERYDSGQTVHVSLRAVTRIDYDAIVVLLSIMIRFKVAGIRFSGDFPKDERASSILMKSGFFESLYHRRFGIQDTYEVSIAHAIHSHANKQVDPRLSATVIERATETVWGSPRRSQGIQRVLLELMQNTNNHASLSRQGDKHWWLSVHHDLPANKVTFTFVDHGVGIFESLDNKHPGSKWFEWRTKLFSLFKPTNNAEILTFVLQGQLHRTVTGQPFRGKGLPGITEVLHRGWISNLVIITNDVVADVARNDYRLLRHPFRGTLVRWELGPSNKSMV